MSYACTPIHHACRADWLVAQALQSVAKDAAKSDQLSSYRGHSSVPQAATGRNRLPNLEPPAPPPHPLALKLMLPPAGERQTDHLGTVAVLVKPKRHQSLAADTRGYQRPLKGNSNSLQIMTRRAKRQACKHPAIHSSGPRASKHRKQAQQTSKQASTASKHSKQVQQAQRASTASKRSKEASKPASNQPQGRGRRQGAKPFICIYIYI